MGDVQRYELEQARADSLPVLARWWLEGDCDHSAMRVDPDVRAFWCADCGAAGDYIALLRSRAGLPAPIVRTHHKTAVIECPYCGKEHAHSYEPGENWSHRIAHCDDAKGRGYYLCLTRKGASNAMD